MANTVDYRVYVIESPSDTDLFHGVNAGNVLQQSLRFAGIHATYRLVVNQDRFLDAFKEMLLGFLNQNEVPILHIIVHGNDTEIGFTSGERLSLAELGEWLRLTNDALGGQLVVCLSACQGFRLTLSGLKHGPAPFATLVGNVGKPSWGDNVVGFTAFYYLLGQGKSIKEAVEGMKVASGNGEFKTIDGQELQRIKDLAAKIDPARLKAAIEALKQKQSQQTS